MRSYQLPNIHSIKPDGETFVALRRRLGWTQQEAATKAGYSVRLIRKIEKHQSVRKQTLKDVIQCYSNALEGPLQIVNNDRFTPQEAPVDPNQDHWLTNKVRDYYNDVYNQRNIDRITTYVCPDIRFTSEGESRSGISAIQQRATTLLNAFTPIEFVIQSFFCNDQTIVALWSARMKHEGDFLGTLATQKWVNVRGTSIFIFSDGLIVEAEEHFCIDNLVRELKGQRRVII